MFGEPVIIDLIAILIILACATHDAYKGAR